MTFIIFTLPRSRSAWLSHWLSYIKEGKRVKAVGHDALSTCRAEEYETFFGNKGLDGTVETGTAYAYKWIVEQMPKTKLLVVQRDPMDCLVSLNKIGIKLPPEDWAKKVEDLWAVSASGVRTIEYADLNLESCARWIWEYCLEEPWDEEWWAQWTPINVQISKEKIMELQAGLNRIRELMGD